ncbi:hypothetical protein [Streptomyces sp. AK04-3B]|uniref:hypothetical protein n=1 Tax=unclassified Streptomyces TaxID=2593676 RepID=UPI0029B86795|nr:hypothetical protein [Streptomyces sp. AK04-3B]MDX3799188.1 hypothetical protein [Streptomyces sp. AK04-3B]
MGSVQVNGPTRSDVYVEVNARAGHGVADDGRPTAPNQWQVMVGARSALRRAAPGPATATAPTRPGVEGMMGCRAG